MQGLGRGRGSTLPAWMTEQAAPYQQGQDWRDVDQVATAALLQQQEHEMRATLAASDQG
jgi:hypothetical protein